MRYYVPLQNDAGAWAVCSMNHRREFVPVVECATLEAAYVKSVNMTMQAMEEAANVLEAAPAARSVVTRGGNRYLRSVRHH